MTNEVTTVDWRKEVESAVLAMKGEGQKAYTFMKAEAPEVAKEYIAYRRLSSALEMAGVVVVVGVFAASAITCLFKAKSENNAEARFAWVAGAVFSVFLALFSGAVSMDGVTKNLKPWVAPRITLIEGIRNVVR